MRQHVEAELGTGSRRGMPAELATAAVMPLASLLTSLQTNGQGLGVDEAKMRLQSVGTNQVAPERTLHIVVDLLQRLRNPLNLMLLLLSVVSLVIRDYKSAAMVVSMVVLSIGLATWQERRSGDSAKALRAMVHTTVAVQRRDDAHSLPVVNEIPLAELVPGDIVHLAAGDIVPADVRLISCRNLFINQAAMTGESMPVEKCSAEVSRTLGPVASVGAGDLVNIALMGTGVVSGTAVAVVVLTGERAVFGGIARAIADAEPTTVFEQGLQRVARLMLGLILVMAPTVFLINFLTKGDWFEALLFSMAVAVGLTPEMLPMLVTVNLGRGAMAMARRKVIVKHLSAIQNLGAMDVLCTDKTGTLTQDTVIMKRHVDMAGNPSVQVLKLAYLNSYFQSGLRNLLDVAVLEHEEQGWCGAGAERYRLIDEVPFDFLRRRMSVVIEGDQGRVIICKGAVEEVLAASSAVEVGGDVAPLDAARRVAASQMCDAMSADGFRVIAVAWKSLPTLAGTPCYSVAEEAGLTLVGYVAFIDPPKESAASALKALRASGVHVKVLTGDNPIVAAKVCRMVGLEDSVPVLGAELEGLDAAALADIAESRQLFAKVNPMQKEALVRALHSRGHVVGVLGDGINDGPALKAADVGISVDTGTDIAKESAGIILLEKSLMVLHDGVIEGRRVFANLTKYLRMGTSSNFGNIFSVVGASAWLPFLPMAPIQVLACNLLYDISQTALPADHVDEEELRSPRKWEIGQLGRYILLMGPISSIFDYVTFASLYWLLHLNSPARGSMFQTAWFIESLLSQMVIVHVIRTQRIPFLESRPAPALVAMTVVMCAVGIWLPFSPLAAALSLQPPPVQFWWLLPFIIFAYLMAAFKMRRWVARHLALV